MDDRDRGSPPDVDEGSHDAQALLDAVVAIGSDLDLHSVLERIVASACKLTSARYGALGVIGAGGELSDFITQGIDDDLHRRIGELPRGHGILGLLIDEPEPLRLSRLQDHPASHGFPPFHPPMTTFLGVPVLVHDTVFGNLYLTEKEGGRAFTRHDEHLVEALARAAAFVIDNARAYAVSERRRVWLEASAVLVDALVPPTSVEEALLQIVVGARSAAGASAVAVLAPDADGSLSIHSHDGKGAGTLPGVLGRLGEQPDAVRRGRSPVTVGLGDGRTAHELALPFRLGEPAVLVVVVDGQAGWDGLAAEELELMATYADQAALAVDRLQAATDREELALVSERDRIARDLHDVVIQRLFATGLSLQGIQGKVVRAEVGERIARAIDDLDGTIRDIRGTIFELRGRPD